MVAKARSTWHRWGRRAFVPVLAFALVGAFVGTAQAVHELGVFQLDKNASTAAQSTPTALEDWDLICKAHPESCAFSPTYAQPSGNTVSSPNAFVVDPSQSATDDILKGGTKDDNPIGTWGWASAKPSPPKNDITDAYAAEYTCASAALPPPSNNVSTCNTSNAGASSGDKLLYFGGDRFSNSGSANLAFWFFQNKITQKLADGTTDAQPGDVCTLSSGCAFGGTHKAGSVPHDPSNPGDILIISAFGPKAQIQVYEWVGTGNAPKPCFTAACSLVPLIPASAGQACEDVTSDSACATTNDVSTPSPWVLSQKNAPANNFDVTNFFEGGINLTSLGLQNACFSSFLLNTRASAAGDAELHDKVIGQLAHCAPGLTTQASQTGTVQPGTALHDTATIQVTGAGGSTAPDPTSPPNVFFHLCGPNLTANPDCSGTGGTLVGATGVPLSGGSNTMDGTATAQSPDVNTSSSPLTNGYYCFRADWAGNSTYPGALSHTNTTDNPDAGECFQVLQHPTTVVTDPQSPSGTNNTAVALNASVYDHAVVTDSDAGGGSPTGTVDFYVCNPTQVTGTGVNAHCAGTGGTGDGTLVNSVTPLTAGPGADQSQATSAAVTANQLGVWCFRATYTPDTAVFTGSSGDENRECFTVTTSSTVSSTQDWVPNDHVTISTPGNATALDGTLSIELRSGSCAGTVVYTESTNTTITNVASPHTFDTTNPTYASAFKVDTGNQCIFYWKIVYTPSNAFEGGAVTKCETSTLSIHNSP